MALEQFSLPFSQPAVEDLRERLRKTRWLDEVSGSEWEYGFSLEFLQDICEHWVSRFDWKAQLESLSRLPHYRYTSDGIGVHFIHQHGKGPSPIPLILTHGWPGSFLEMLRIIPLLTDPESHGGDPANSFDVVVPSLPGYGYSDRPAYRGMNLFRIADLWVGLM